MARKSKTTRQISREKEADTLQKLVDKTQRKIDLIREDIAEMEAKRDA